MLARSATVTRSDRVIFAFLLSTYLAVVPINLFWFGKMLQGALKLLLPRKPKPKPTENPKLDSRDEGQPKPKPTS